MKESTQVITRSVAAESARAVARALAAATAKIGFPQEEVKTRLRARDRAVWSRFRFELAREIAPIFQQAFPQVSAAYLWDLEDAESEAAESPAGANVDLVLRLEANSAGLEDFVVGLSRELSEQFSDRVPETPLVLTVHAVTPAMVATGKGVAALFRSINVPLTLVSGEA